MNTEHELIYKKNTHKKNKKNKKKHTQNKTKKKQETKNKTKRNETNKHNSCQFISHRTLDINSHSKEQQLKINIQKNTGYNLIYQETPAIN